MKKQARNCRCLDYVWYLTLVFNSSISASMTMFRHCASCSLSWSSWMSSTSALFPDPPGGFPRMSELGISPPGVVALEEEGVTTTSSFSFEAACKITRKKCNINRFYYCRLQFTHKHIMNLENKQRSRNSMALQFDRKMTLLQN